MICLLVVLLAPLSANAYVFLRNLRQGDIGLDVRELQKALNSNVATRVNSSGAGSPGFETSYFGLATKRAVIAFQELYRNEILVPAGLSQGTGFVGALTRQKLNALSFGSVIATTTVSIAQPTQSLLSSVPVITSLSATNIGNGDTIIIYGKNFQATNTVVISIEVPGKFIAVQTASTTSMQLTVDTTLSAGIKKQMSKFDPRVRDFIVDKIRTQMNKQNPSADGSWYFPAILTVKNSSGTSNSVPININILKGV